MENKDNQHKRFNMLRIMLNTNVFCRPFDDKTDPEIQAESDYSERIIELAELKQIKIVASDILYAELGLIEDERKRDIVLNEINGVSQERINTNDKIHSLAQELGSLISDYSDDLHIASAAVSGCECLVTCDKQLAKARSKIESFLLSKGYRLKILAPKEFIDSFGD